MTFVLYSFISDVTASMLRSKLERVPRKISEEVMRYLMFEDQVRSLTGKLLLMNGLSRAGAENCLEDLSYTLHGKPRLSQCRFTFNISHSGDLVICAISDDVKEIGIDAELVRIMNFSDFRDAFSIDEWTGIMMGGTTKFFDYWTRKEAILKLTGYGIGVCLDTVEVTRLRATYLGVEYRLLPIAIDSNYSVHLATEIDLKQIEVIGVSAYDGLYV
jgi:4'-phosphopantetheinyl transferase